MRIEALEAFSMTDPEDGKHFAMSEGDRKGVSAKAAAIALSMGWAKDVDGNMPTGERSLEPVTVSPEGVLVRPI